MIYRRVFPWNIEWPCYNGYIDMVFLLCEFHNSFRCAFDMKDLSHRWHWYSFSPVWVLWWYTSCSFHTKVFSMCTCCEILVSLVSDMFSHQCELFEELEDNIFEKKPHHISCIDMAYSQFDFFVDIQAGISMQKPCYTGSTDMASLQCEFYDCFKCAILL